jgi:hypothetical protein
MVGRPACRLFVEGGGDHNEALKTECRRAFSKLLERAGLGGGMPRVIPCGGRKRAFDQFCTAIRSGGPSLLLVDSEAPVTAASPWEHVATREGDGWAKPVGAADEQLHLMVQCMESWLLADREALGAFFGAGFREKALPDQANDIEKIGKDDLFEKLNNATHGSKTKGSYRKGMHSFKLLEMIDPEKLRRASRWAGRFFNALGGMMG